MRKAYLSAADVAAVLGVSRSYAYKLMEQFERKRMAVRIGTTIRVSLDKFAIYMATLDKSDPADVKKMITESIMEKK